jgi:Xaa-Pro aminopeptidase
MGKRDQSNIRYASKLHFGTSSSDVVTGVDTSRMRTDRQARLREVMRKHDVAAILIGGADNARYATGFWWSEFQLNVGYVLFFADHEPVVFAPAGSLQQMPDQARWITEWRPAHSWMDGVAPPSAQEQQAKRFAAQVKAELASKSLATDELAVSDIGEFGRHHLTEVGLRLRPGLPILLESGSIKTPDEVSCLKLAASLGTSGFHAARSALAPGVTQGQVAVAGRRAIEDAGAELAFTAVMSGPLGFERSASGGDRRIEYGDLAFVLTCGTSFMGYTSCLYRQFIVGRQPTSEETSMYAKLLDRMDEAISLMKPGASTADVAAVLAPASAMGYAAEVECFSIELGHGVGLVNAGSRSIHYNPPIITREWSLDHPEEIREGMVLAIEGIEGEHRVRGVRLENLVLIGPDGPELIDHYPRDEILVAGV